MPPEALWTGSQLLRKLLGEYLAGKLSVETFSRDVEVAYNDAEDKSALTEAERAIFGPLFDEVAWFSPVPEERLQVPQLRNEEQIRRAALAAQEQLDAL